MGIFEGKKAKERKSHFKTLVEVAIADGELARSEREFLGILGAKWGLSVKEVTAVLKKPGKVKFVPPKDPGDQLAQLFDIVMMMLVDGVIDRREMDYCMTVASRLGFRPSIVPSLVAKVIEAVKKGASKDKVTSEVSDFLKG